MRNFLSTQKLENDIHAYRGERSTWMFDAIPIDKALEKKIRSLVFWNSKSRSDKIVENHKLYNSPTRISIYDHIKSKENLSLADAMLVARYGDQNFIEKICNLIEKSKVQDNLFKSYTYNEDFATEWAKIGGTRAEKGANNFVVIITKAKIKKGSQAGYTAKSGQHEVILNDNKKEITFSNVKYDKKHNIFYFDSTVENA